MQIQPSLLVWLKLRRASIYKICHPTQPPSKCPLHLKSLSSTMSVPEQRACPLQHFFDVWLVKYRFHLVGQLTTQLVSFTPCPAGCPWAARVSSVPKLRARPRVVRRGHEFWGWRAYSGKVGKKSSTYSFSQPTLSLNSHLSIRWWKVFKWYKETYKRYGNKLGRLLCQDIDVELPVHWNRISRILYQVKGRIWSSLQLSTLLLLVTLVHRCESS